MSKQMIKLYADTPDNYLAASQVLSPFNFVYLHGQLEEINGYDQLYYGAGDIEDLLNKETFVKVVFKDGSEHDAVAYVWDGYIGTQYIHRGLVCSVDDEEAKSYARAKFEERSVFI